MKALPAIVLSFLAIIFSGCVSKLTHSLVGRYVLVAGGYNERMTLDLKADRSYTLWHTVDFHEIDGEDRGTWGFDGRVVALKPTEHGAADGDMFLPYHCARLVVEKRGSELLLVSESVPLIPAATRQRAVFIKQTPNQISEVSKQGKN